MWGMQKTETTSTSLAFQILRDQQWRVAKVLVTYLFSHQDLVVTDTQQCNQAQPCGNCARRYPPPVCEYKTTNQRCAIPALPREMSP